MRHHVFAPPFTVERGAGSREFTRSLEVAKKLMKGDLVLLVDGQTGTVVFNDAGRLVLHVSNYFMFLFLYQYTLLACYHACFG